VQSADVAAVTHETRTRHVLGAALLAAAIAAFSEAHLWSPVRPSVAIRTSKLDEFLEILAMEPRATVAYAKPPDAVERAIVERRIGPRALSLDDGVASAAQQLIVIDKGPVSGARATMYRVERTMRAAGFTRIERRVFANPPTDQ
jgi:hypothetical protein